MLEAMACGMPVAAFPVPGPRDVIVEGSTGALDEDLAAATFRALRLDGKVCVEFARAHGWAHSTRRFLERQRRAGKDWPAGRGHTDRERHFTVNVPELRHSCTRLQKKPAGRR